MGEAKYLRGLVVVGIVLVLAVIGLATWGSGGDGDNLSRYRELYRQRTGRSLIADDEFVERTAKDKCDLDAATLALSIELSQTADDRRTSLALIASAIELYCPFNREVVADVARRVRLPVP